MWEENIFSFGDVQRGLLDDYLRENDISPDEGIEHYQACIDRLQNMIRHIEKQAADTQI